MDYPANAGQVFRQAAAIDPWRHPGGAGHRPDPRHWRATLEGKEAAAFVKSSMCCRTRMKLTDAGRNHGRLEELVPKGMIFLEAPRHRQDAVRQGHGGGGSGAADYHCLRSRAEKSLGWGIRGKYPSNLPSSAAVRARDHVSSTSWIRSRQRAAPTPAAALSIRW